MTLRFCVTREELENEIFISMIRDLLFFLFVNRARGPPPPPPPVRPSIIKAEHPAENEFEKEKQIPNAIYKFVLLLSFQTPL